MLSNSNQCNQKILASHDECREAAPTDWSYTPFPLDTEKSTTDMTPVRGQRAFSRRSTVPSSLSVQALMICLESTIEVWDHGERIGLEAARQ